jgi:heme exporter protein A
LSQSYQPERLVAQGLCVERGGRRILDGVDFDLGAGEALVVLGRNGAGKSTLLRALAGHLRLSAGSVRFNAGDPGAPLAEKAHYIGHADGLKAALTGLENLEFWATMLGSGAAPPKALSPQAALKKVGLARIGDFPVGYLSAGQKRRVALARLLVAHRALWILDEPATALDVAAQQQFAQTMAEHRANGGFIVAATHAPLGLVDAHELRLGERPASGAKPTPASVETTMGDWA